MFAGENVSPARNTPNDVASLVAGGIAEGCRTSPALGLLAVGEIAVVWYHIPSRVGVFYPAVIIRLLRAILSRVGGSMVNARARGDGILP